MRLEEGDKSEVRRIQITGGSTFIVSLPKKWVTQHGLNARDEVRIEWRPSGSLRLSAETTSVRKRRRADIELDEIGSEFLFDHLIGAYLCGADRIRLFSRKAITRSDRSIIRRFIQATRGIEISNETDYTVEMIALLNTSEMPLHSSINRMYLIVSSQIRDVSEVLSGGDKSLLSDSDEREKEIDALRLLLERQVGQILESASIETSFGINRWEASELSNIVRIFERIGDHCYIISNLCLEQDIPEILTPKKVPASVIPTWQKSIKSLIANLKRRKIKEIQESKLEIQKAVRSLDEFEEGLWTSEMTATDALFFDKLSESMRRILAYTLDMAEVLINIQTHRESIEEDY